MEGGLFSNTEGRSSLVQCALWGTFGTECWWENTAVSVLALESAGTHTRHSVCKGNGLKVLAGKRDQPWLRFQ